jgi:hypothetical protein
MSFGAPLVSASTYTTRTDGPYTYSANTAHTHKRLDTRKDTRAYTHGMKVEHEDTN